MTMTNEEIVQDYIQARNKNKQIKILVDLNTVSPSEIRKILAEAGVAGVKMPERVVKWAQEAESSGPTAPDGALIYDRIETILSAIPDSASKYARNNAWNLVVSLFSDYVGERLGKDVPDEP